MQIKVMTNLNRLSNGYKDTDGLLENAGNCSILIQIESE